MRKRDKKSSPSTDHLAAEPSSGFLVRQLKLALKQRQDATTKLANLAEKALHRLHELNCQQPPTIQQLLQENIQLKTTQRPPSFIPSPTRRRNHLLHQEIPPPSPQPQPSSSPSNNSICIINTLSQTATQSKKKKEEEQEQRQGVLAPSTNGQHQHPTNNNNMHSLELEKLQYTTLMLTELLKKAEARADRAAEHLANAQKESRELRARMEIKENSGGCGMIGNVNIL